jgi:hypothetical protein
MLALPLGVLNASKSSKQIPLGLDFGAKVLILLSLFCKVLIPDTLRLLLSAMMS